MFSNEAKARFKAAHPDSSFVSILQMVKAEWTMLEAADRAIFESRHAESQALWVCTGVGVVVWALVCVFAPFDGAGLLWHLRRI